jgi:hypothetical protein
MRVRLLLCLLPALAALMPTGAWACQCFKPGSPAQEVRKSTAVFRGRVLSHEEDTGNKKRRVRFEVLAAWKGPVAPELTVETGWGGTDCGLSFQSGHEYVVYANPRDPAASNPMDTLETDACTRSNRVDWAPEDVKYLEAGSTRTDGALRHFSPGFLSCASLPEGTVPPALLLLLGLASRRMRRLRA